MRLLPGPRTVDDAFITFRYAQNLLAGNGLVYNPGEWVLGTTTPLYALLLSGLGLVSGGADADFPLIALVVNGLFDALTCYILIRFGESLARPLAGTAAALIWAITPMSVSFAIGGMETSLLILLMSATFYFHLKHRSVLAALFAGLSVLTRPDALLFVVLIGVDRLIDWFKKTGRRPNAAEILSFSVPIAIWIMISSTIYGTPVPHSIAAKTSAYILPGDAALIRLLQHFATPFFGQNFFGNWWIGLGIIIFPTLFITGWRHALQDFRHAWPMALYPAFYFSVFALANPLIFRWYLTPPLPMYFIGIFLGLTDIGRQTRKTWISTAAIAVAFALTINAWTLHPDHGLDRPAPEMAYVKLENSYHEAASIVAPLLVPGDTLAAGDIGVLGYKTGAHILDTVGLISPQSTRYYPISEEKYVINYAIPSELILIEAPDYIVVLEVYGRETFMKEVNFIAQYALVATIETDIYGTDGMLVFERK